MLKVNFYQSTSDLINVNTSGDAPLIICPSPVVADGLRRLISTNIEILTISKWVTDYLKSKNLKRTNKAELMLRLSSVWRYYFPKEESIIFFKSFELFTDLRSFTLSLELLAEFLKELDEVTTKSILLFWTFLQNEKLIDEHLSYQLISTLEVGRPLWFMGFKHLSGIQIDMLKQISEMFEVEVFIPKDVFEESLSSDWIRWLIPEANTAREDISKKLKVIYFPKNKLNIALKSMSDKLPIFDISLACTNLTLNNRQEVASDGLFIKSPEDLFLVGRTKLFEELSEKVKADVSIKLVDFIQQLDDRKTRALFLEDFILYKILLLLNEAVVAFGEFQVDIDLFSLKVFEVIIGLNLPRVSMATITMNPQSRLLELNELPFKESIHPLVVVASSQYGSLKSQDSKYSEKMLEALRVIAPIKRAGLDFAYLKSELRQVLSEENNYLFLEEGLDVIDLAWKEILKSFEIEVINPNINYQLKIQKDYLFDLIKPGPYLPKNLSASRLQTYMDCPRKYYFSYIEKIDHRPEERMKIAADEMGTLEHEILGAYFQESKIDSSLVFENDRHEKLCLEALDKFILTHRIQLNEKSKFSTFYELLNYSRNGIEYLIQFILNNNGHQVEFERPFGKNQWGLVGSIDCVIHLPENEIALFDFKRSLAAIGTKKDTLAFEKIQIWIYLFILLKSQDKKIRSWGYLNLSEVETSQVYDEATSSLLTVSKMEEFQERLELLIEKTKNEKDFLAFPRTSSVCDFCEVQLMCDKGGCSQ